MSRGTGQCESQHLPSHQAQLTALALARCQEEDTGGKGTGQSGNRAHTRMAKARGEAEVRQRSSLPSYRGPLRHTFQVQTAPTRPLWNVHPDLPFPYVPLPFVGMGKQASMGICARMRLFVRAGARVWVFAGWGAGPTCGGTGGLWCRG